MTVIDIIIHITQQKRDMRMLPDAASQKEILELARIVNLKAEKVKIDLEALALNGVISMYYNVNRVPYYSLTKTKP